MTDETKALLELCSLWAAGAFAGVVVAGTALTQTKWVSAVLSAFVTRAPGLDLVVAGFSWIPWVFAVAFAGWWAVFATLVGQYLGLFVWSWVHETICRRQMKGPRIVGYINRRVGRFANHLALAVTAVAFPIFWGIRFGEVFVYPFLVWIIKLPPYRHAEWVNVSRQKFNGLVGHDLIWCLYCDWMTGVYSLGAEMLRNVESFWCPIKFYDGKKCDNCKIDFPDIAGARGGGWVEPTGTMADVVEAMKVHYDGGDHSWWGHPGRTQQLTVDGRPAAPSDHKD